MNQLNPHLDSIYKNQTNNNGTLVSDIIDSVLPDNLITDSDADALEGIAITAVDNTNGNWVYSIDNGNHWSPIYGASENNALLLASDEQTRVRFIPKANFVGEIPGITFRAWDQTSWANGSNADVTDNDGTTAYSDNVETASISVLPVILYWDYNGQAGGIGCNDPGPSGYVWDPNDTTATPRWRIGSESGPFTTWIPGNTAIFEGNPGTVTLSGSTSVDSIIFNVDGYTISGGSFTTTSNGSFVTVNTGNTGSDTISSVINGNGALTKDGLGTIVLTGYNNYFGDTFITQGILKLANYGQIAMCSTIHPNSGTTFMINDGVHVVGSITGPGDVVVNSGVLYVASISVGSRTGNLIILPADSDPLDLNHTLYWDADGDGLASTLGGTGVWNMSNMYWRDKNGNLTTWIDGDNAIFDGLSGTVTITSEIKVHSINFNVDGYNIISNNTPSAYITLTYWDSTFTVVSGTATIEANIRGGAPLIKKGQGTLRLAGTSYEYTGVTLIKAGTIELASLSSCKMCVGSTIFECTGTTFRSKNGTSRVGAITGTGMVEVSSGELIVNSLNVYESIRREGATLTIAAMPGGPQSYAAIENVTSPNANGTYTLGDSIFIDVNFDNPIDVIGTPQLLLAANISDQRADYLYSIGASTLRFIYNVEGGANTSSLDYLTSQALVLNGGTIQSWTLNNATLTLPSPGQTDSLGANSDLVVETPRLTIYGASTTLEGKIYTLQLSADQLNNHTISTWHVDWGDGNADTYTTNPTHVTHVYADDGSYVITTDATLDDDTPIAGGESGALAVNVSNVAPYLSIRGQASATANSPYTLYLSSSDPGADTIQHWTVNWGDENIQTVNGNPSSIQHYYANSGNYSISATATDEDGTYATGGGAAGALDPSFGTSGEFTTNIAGGGDQAMALQADGKIIVAGQDGDGNSNLIRYLSDGSIDADFGSQGIVNIADMTAMAVAMQADGKILVAGYADNGSNNSDFCIVRYNADGSLDSNFGGGRVLTNFATGSYDHAFGIVTESDGKIVVAGQSNCDFAVARYNANGALDTSFGTAGKVTTSFGEWSACGYALAIQTINNVEKIVVAGCYNADFALARYNPSGALDTSFGSNGKVTTSFGGYPVYAVVHSMSIQLSDNKIIVAGYSGHIPSGSEDFAMARYTASGALDTSFNQTGKVTMDFGDSIDYAYAVAIQHIGSVDKIVVAGSSYNEETGTTFVLTRYNTDGSLDTSFGSEGIVITDFSSSVVVQSDGRIVLAGAANGDFAVARYFPGIISITVTVS